MDACAPQRAPNQLVCNEILTNENNRCCSHLFFCYTFVIKIICVQKYSKYLKYSRISHFGSIRNMNTHLCGYSKYEYVFMRHPDRFKYMLFVPWTNRCHWNRPCIHKLLSTRLGGRCAPPVLQAGTIDRHSKCPIASIPTRPVGSNRARHMERRVVSVPLR